MAKKYPNIPDCFFEMIVQEQDTFLSQLTKEQNSQIEAVSLAYK